MDQKTYTFPKKGGGNVTKTLAPPTSKRMVDFLGLCGKKDFNSLRTTDGQLDYAMFVLNAGSDPEKLAKTMDVCLIEGTAEVDFSNVDLRVTDEVIQDFFEQRSRTLLERMKNSQE